MIPLELKIATALVLDLLLGDPWGFPHPIRLIGGTADRLEAHLRRIIPSERKAGVAVWFLLTGAAGAATLFVLRLLGGIHPLGKDLAGIILLYFSFAGRDLARHGLQVFRALRADDLPEARRRLGMIVSRDTGSMSRGEIVRSTVESIAENVSDGVIAPLFFAFLGGPAAAISYKAISTMDSMFGYKNERYLRFGWFAARADDFFNYLPARLTGLFLVLAAAVTGRRAGPALRTFLRDGNRRSSPNAGYPEAAAAGALGIYLGGRASYFGKPVEKPRIGNDLRAADPECIREALVLMTVCVVLFAAAGGALRWVITRFIR